MENLNIIKIGGNILNEEQKLHSFLGNLVKVPGKKILVHGGGKLASSMGAKLGVEPKMHNGRRITDDQTLRIITMVYAGWINKSIVAQLNAFGNLAIGLCGADAQLIPAEKRPVGEIDYGFAGDILQKKVNVKFIDQLLQSELLLVVAPVTADSKGQLLNTNADTIASALAAALSKMYKVQLIFCFEKKGVLVNVTDDGSVLDQLDSDRYKQLKAEGVIDMGMIPKLDNAFDALDKGTHRVVIGHADNILLMVSQTKHEGTIIQKT